MTNRIDNIPRMPYSVLSREEGDGLRCLACAHRCLIPPGGVGVCRMRLNREGILHVPFGCVAGLQIDPIEKKPFYHAWPGCATLSFGMLGCNFHCSFCQNWVSSQVARISEACAGVQRCDAADIVDRAVANGASVVVGTYNEPLITVEWAMQVFECAKNAGLRCGLVSNGFATQEALAYLTPVLDIFKVDLKAFDDEAYRSLGGRLGPVLDTIARLAAAGIWMEVVTLVVPGFNDSLNQLRGMAKYLAGLSSDIPWHVTAFYPNFKMNQNSATPVAALERAWNCGKEAGLRHVYAGNMPGRVGDREHTRCHACGEIVIERMGFQILRNTVSRGCCPYCSTPIPGRWA